MREGTFRGKVVGHCLGKAGTGSPQIGIGFEIPPQEEGEAAESLTWYGYFSDAAIDITNRALTALGWDPEANGFKYEDLNPDKPEDGILVGREADVVLGIEPDLNDQPRMRIKFINDPDRPRGVAIKERMDGAEASSFGDRLRAQLKLAGKNTGGKAAGGAKAGPGAKGAPSKAPAKPGSGKPSSKAPGTQKNGPGAGGAGGGDPDIPF